MRAMKKTAALLVCVLVLITGMATGVGALSNSEIQLGAEDVEAAPGETVAMNVSVTNIGERATGGSYTVVATGNSSSFNATNATIQGPIQSNETVNTSINITASESVEHGATTFELALIAEDGDQVANTTGTIEYNYTDSSSTTETPTSTPTEKPSGGAAGPVVAEREPGLLDRLFSGLDSLAPDFDWDWWPF